MIVGLRRGRTPIPPNQEAEPARTWQVLLALAPGRYTQLRLILGDGSYVVEGGERHDLSVPSGLQTGIKLIHPFDIEPEQICEITLDFDAARSIHVTGNGQHVLQPTIRCVWNAIAGAVTGTVLSAAAKSTVWTIAGGDTVSAFADSLTGGFRLSMLPAGSYDLRIDPFDPAWLDTVLAGVSGCRRASSRRSRCRG